MTFDPPLIPATLVRRYKRFLADVELDDGTLVTAHCPNTGAMTGCATPNDTIWYSTSSNSKRKYPYSWELTQTQNGDLICVNTIRANQLVEEALINGDIKEFSDFSALKREVKYGNENSKIDFLLTSQDKTDIYIEVKSVTLLTDGQGYFPDAVTTRGQKHLRELAELVQQGKKAVLLFAVLHTGILSVKAAAHIDAEYATLLQQAKDTGVIILAYKADFHISRNEGEIRLSQAIPVKI